jgi:AraC family transcriptional regulator, transcriptional activator of pobA
MPDTARPRPRRRVRPTVPAFALYGESEGAPASRAELLHVESVQSRSRRYQWEIDAHVHHGLHQVVWVGRGMAEVALDESRSRCEGPAAIVIAPGVVHAFRFARHTEGYVLTASPGAMVEGEASDVARALAGLFARSRVLAFEPGSAQAARLGALFEAMLAEFNAPDAAGGPLPVWLARSVLWRLAHEAGLRGDGAQAGTAAPPHRAQAARFMALVEAHHLEHWPVARYAATLGLSEERLNRMLRTQTGRTALQLVHERLAREAQRRLLYIAAPVSRLAWELGFPDAAYFSRFFKRQVGVSPAQFRRNAAPG